MKDYVSTLPGITMYMALGRYTGNGLGSLLYVQAFPCSSALLEDKFDAK